MEKTLDIAGMLAEEERKHAPFRGTVKGYKDGPNNMRIIAEAPYCYTYPNKFFEYVGSWRNKDLRKDTVNVKDSKFDTLNLSSQKDGRGRLISEDGSLYVEC